jgi:hypothetical protein
MTEKNKKIIIGAGALAAAITVAAAVLSLTGEEKIHETVKAGPEAVVIEFTEAMKAGDFEKAEQLCDLETMQEYLDAYMQKWEAKSIKDSSAFASTVRILGETTIEIGEVDMQDGVCFIDYSLKLDKNTRKCRAGLKKEEGEWKVTEITDRN